MAKNSIILIGAIVAGMTISVARVAYAGCSDPAEPEVNWRRCYLDSEKMPESDLKGAILRETSLARVDLSGSNLTGADARRAKFFSAKLIGTDFTNARLLEVDFTKADLTDAKFVRADLRRARFFRARLSGAEFTGADITDADFLKADLTGAIWLDGIKICAQGSLGKCK